MGDVAATPEGTGLKCAISSIPLPALQNDIRNMSEAALRQAGAGRKGTLALSDLHIGCHNFSQPEQRAWKMADLFRLIFHQTRGKPVCFLMLTLK